MSLVALLCIFASMWVRERDRVCACMCVCVSAHDSVCIRALTLITILVVASEYIVTVFTGSVGTDAPTFYLWGDNLATHLTTMRGPFQANSQGLRRSNNDDTKIIRITSRHRGISAKRII